MVDKIESKHARFLRLAQRRLERAKEELRLISQLASSNYENTPEEAKAIVEILDEDVRNIAEAFGVEYATRIGNAASQTTQNTQPVNPLVKTAVLDAFEVMKALDHLQNGRIDEARDILRAAIV